MKNNNKISIVIFIMFIFMAISSVNVLASNIITIDEVIYDEPIVLNGLNGGTFDWNANGVLVLDNYDGGSIRGNGDLDIIIKGNNKITCSQGEIYGLCTLLGNLHIKGKGSLTVDAKELAKWSSAIYITADNEDKSIYIDDVDVIANGAFSAIETHVEDYDRDGNIKSTALYINNANLTLSGAKSIFICGDEAKVKLSSAKVIEPSSNHIVDFYFNDIKTAKVFSKNKEDMKVLESEYEANSNIDDLKTFLAEFGMESNITIKKQNLSIIFAVAFLLIIIVLGVNIYNKKNKKNIIT